MWRQLKTLFYERKGATCAAYFPTLPLRILSTSFAEQFGTQSLALQSQCLTRIILLRRHPGLYAQVSAQMTDCKAKILNSTPNLPQAQNFF